MFEEVSARDSLARQFEKLGLSYFSLHPTIRTVMERSLISTGDVQHEVGRFLQVARMADQRDLSDRDKRHVLEKAYERHGRKTGYMHTSWKLSQPQRSRRRTAGLPYSRAFSGSSLFD